MADLIVVVLAGCIAFLLILWGVFAAFDRMAAGIKEFIVDILQ